MLICWDMAPWGRNGFEGCIYDKEGKTVKGVVDGMSNDKEHEELYTSESLSKVSAVYPNFIFSCCHGGLGRETVLFYQWENGEDKPELLAGYKVDGIERYERYKLKGKDVTKEKFDEWVKTLGQTKRIKWYSVNEANVKKYLG